MFRIVRYDHAQYVELNVPHGKRKQHKTSTHQFMSPSCADLFVVIEFEYILRSVPGVLLIIYSSPV